MAYVITDNCVSCGTCAANCPAEAIDMGDDKYVIDQDKCVSCGTCKENCPADAIVEGRESGPFYYPILLAASSGGCFCIWGSNRNYVFT